MPTRINIIDRIIIAIAILVQPIEAVGIEISRIVGANESAPGRGVVTGIEIIQPGFLVVIVPAVSDRVYSRNVAGVKRDGAVAPRIVNITANPVAACVVDADHVTKQIALEIIGVRYTGSIGIYHADDLAFVVQIHDGFGSTSCTVILTCFAFLNQSAGLVMEQSTVPCYKDAAEATPLRFVYLVQSDY